MAANPYLPQSLPILLTSMLRRKLVEYQRLLTAISDDDSSGAAQERAEAEEAIRWIEEELAIREETRSHYAEYGHHA